MKTKLILNIEKNQEQH